jgi:chloramphenicol-sensitive protein RarD
MHKSGAGKGVFLASVSYLLWGVFPLYWKLLSAVNALHILALRILLSLFLVGGILLLRHNTAWLAAFRDKKKGPLVVLSGLTVSFNWGLYIWAVNQGRTIEASLGYYINPLVSIMLGLLIFRERLRPLQWAAFAVALLGVLLLAALSGVAPWVSLGLALSFGMYGVFKKTIALSSLESLGAETLAAAPLGLLLLCFRFDQPVPLTGWQGLSYLAALPVHSWILLLLCGAVTAFPLYLFGSGARLLPLSALGFIQFISPTLMFIMGRFVFGESFPPYNYAAFGCIWIAAVLYIFSLKGAPRLVSAPEKRV